MNFSLLLAWVLVLSWLTQTAASPDWRASTITQAILPASQALDTVEWVPSKETVAATIDETGALYVARPDNRWAVITRRLSLVPAGNSTDSSDSSVSLLRFRATLETDTPALDRVTLTPGPVLHLFLDHGERQYPFVARPMFFQSSVEVDTLIELRERHESLEIALIAAPNSNWRLSDLSLSAVAEHPRFAHSFSALIALWGLTVLLGVLIAWRRSKLPTLIVGLVVILVLIGVLSSRTQIVKLFEFLSNELQAVGGQVTSGHFGAAMQSGHLLLFSALTFLALVFHRRWWMTRTKVLAGVVVLAIATEALQNHAFGRSPDIQDFALDLIGIAIGTMVYGVGLLLSGTFFWFRSR